ncbi:Chemoreceptor glutamine deamidase CheD [Burkholderiales bacterium]|nr:Chemoreceptor glutamine deamidase CheD [Burkholderiales bacterium]
MSEIAPEDLATSRYFDQNFGLPAIKIMPGEYYVATRPMVLVTVLGSCVAVCLRDVVKGMGGLNHFMLPESGEEQDGPVSTAARYGGYAMEVLINHLIKLGARREHLRAKVFGGAQVLAGAARQAIGERNAQFALRYLAAEGIPVDAQDLLDVFPRKIYFFPATGKVLVRKLRDAQGGGLAHREARYQKRLVRASVSGAVELYEPPGEPVRPPAAAAEDSIAESRPDRGPVRQPAAPLPTANK